MSTTAGTTTAPNPTVARIILRGESDYDRVTSMLLSVVAGALLVFGWLALIYATNQAYAARVTGPIEIVEVSGDGGGSPDGVAGGVEAINVPGGADADRASNNEEETGDFEEPSVEATPAALLDTVSEAGGSLAEVDLGAVMPTGGKLASGKRASKLGNGAVGFGFGPGDGGVRREDRWGLVFPPGQTAEDYARQLDFFQIELGVISGNQLIYLSRFSDETPRKRIGSGAADGRLYFLWRGQGRRASDIALLRKAGIEVGEGVIFQFCPDAVESALAQLEYRFKGRTPAEIRSTKFRVVERGNGYAFEVFAQDGLR